MFHLPQNKRHSFDRPNNTRQQQRRIEGAQRQLNGIPFQFADSGNDETKAHAAHSLQQRDNDDVNDVAVTGDAEHDNHEDQDERRLAAHHHKLCDYMGEENLTG